MKAKDGLVVETLAEGGALILDETTGVSHALRPEAAAVWRCLEAGNSEPDRIVTDTGLDQAVVLASLKEIEAAGLVELTDNSRRQLLARAAAVAGAAAGLKLIETIATPTPAQAQSFAPDGFSQQK